MESKKGAKSKKMLEEMQKFLDTLRPAREKELKPSQRGLYPFDLRAMVVAGSEYMTRKLKLFCWVGWYGYEGTIVVVQALEPEGRLAVHERSISLDEAEPLADLLKSVGLPKRKPDVQPNWYSAQDMAGWDSTTLRLERDDGLLETNFYYMRCAEGKDAEGVRTLFRYLLKLAEVSNKNIWGLLTAK